MLSVSYMRGAQYEKAIHHSGRESGMKWKVNYENDVGPYDEGFWEWWTVSNDEKSFKCDSKDDADWLCTTLNLLAATS